MRKACCWRDHQSTGYILNRPHFVRYPVASKSQGNRGVMAQIRFTQEFKQEAVRQVVDCGHPVGEVAARLGVSQHSLYTWIRLHNKPAATAAEAEIKRQYFMRQYFMRQRAV
ncbi:UNVERIFIED_CONTAM: ykgN [Trichonephila clavipes]